MADSDEQQKSNHGWKTYLAAFAAAVNGVVEITNGNVSGGVKMFIAAVALVGVRGALAKLIAAARQLAG
jgi:hypothetical protein